MILRVMGDQRKPDLPISHGPCKIGVMGYQQQCGAGLVQSPGQDSQSLLLRHRVQS